MTDYEMILHDMVTTRGAEAVVRRMLSTDAEIMSNIADYGTEWDYPAITDKQIRFESSRAAYKIARRIGRGAGNGEKRRRKVKCSR